MMGKVRSVTTPESSNIQSIGYDRESQAMTVIFKNGSTYTYALVPIEVWVDFIFADSPGRFFSEHVRNAYKFVRVTSLPGVEIDARPPCNI